MKSRPKFRRNWVASNGIFLFKQRLWLNENGFFVQYILAKSALKKCLKIILQLKNFSYGFVYFSVNNYELSRWDYRTKVYGTALDHIPSKVNNILNFNFFFLMALIGNYFRFRFLEINENNIFSEFHRKR